MPDGPNGGVSTLVIYINFYSIFPPPANSGLREVEVFRKKSNLETSRSIGCHAMSYYAFRKLSYHVLSIRPFDVWYCSATTCSARPVVLFYQLCLHLSHLSTVHPLSLPSDLARLHHTDHSQRNLCGVHNLHAAVLLHDLSHVDRQDPFPVGLHGAERRHNPGRRGP